MHLSSSNANSSHGSDSECESVKQWVVFRDKLVALDCYGTFCEILQTDYKSFFVRLCLCEMFLVWMTVSAIVLVFDCKAFSVCANVFKCRIHFSYIFWNECVVFRCSTGVKTHFTTWTECSVWMIDLEAMWILLKKPQQTFRMLIPVLKIRRRLRSIRYRTERLRKRFFSSSHPLLKLLRQ